MIEVQITHERTCAFKVRPGTKHVCVHCGLNRLHPNHGSFSWQSQSRLIDNVFVRAKTSEMWISMFIEELKGAGMTKATSVEVQGRITFPDRRSRDEGNHRYPYEKFLGDALQRGGWLENDDWDSYRFPVLDRAPFEKGANRCQLLLYVMPAP